MRRLSWLAFSLGLVGLLQAPVLGQPKKEFNPGMPKVIEPPRPSFRHLDGQNLVFVANGVNGSTQAGDNLMDVNSDRQLGLKIVNVPWCRQNAAFQDLVDQE